jgi:hypothetical protein
MHFMYLSVTQYCEVWTEMYEAYVVFRRVRSVNDKMKIYKNKDMFRLCLFMFHTFYLVAMCVHFNTMNNILLKTSQPVGVFYTDKYRVVKITYLSSEVILRTTNHTVIYPNLGTSLEVITLRPTVWYRRWICVTRAEQRAWEVHMMKGEIDLVPPTWRVGAFYKPCSGLLAMVQLLYTQG